MYDVFFLSFDEPHADRYWEILKGFHPIARRVNGVPGIHAAHAACARKSRTGHFFVVDADNEVLDPSIFEYTIPEWDREYVHLWYARNPVNNLIYGWGGIKLFPKSVFSDMRPKLDMTTSFPLKVMETMASVTHFNVSPFETWRSAFRECVKLTHSSDPAAEDRLKVWCNEAKGQHADWALRGAREGHQYALGLASDSEALHLINDYSWLEKRFSGMVS